MDFLVTHWQMIIVGLGSAVLLLGFAYLSYGAVIWRKQLPDSLDDVLEFAAGAIISGLVIVAIGIVLQLFASDLASLIVDNSRSAWDWFSAQEAVEWLIMGQWYQVTLKISGVVGGIITFFTVVGFVLRILPDETP